MSRTASPPLSARLIVLTCALIGFGLGADGDLDFEGLTQRATIAGEQARAWFLRTPPAERVTWGGLAASAALGLGVLVERSFRLRHRKVLPRAFAERFLDRLRDGKLDRGKAADFCELNPSPAARIAHVAVRRWGRPPAELERAVAMARQVEGDRLRRHVGTLRRISALSPLLGLLGTLFGAERALNGLPAGAAWGPVIGAALAPLTAGVALAILALVAYDGLMGRVEKLTNELDRLGAETIDAIVVAAIESRLAETRPHISSGGRGPHISGPSTARIDSPEPTFRHDPRILTDD